MRDITLEGQVRTQIGKRSRAIRREGKVPGIYYVHGEQNIPITVPEKSLKPLIFTSETHVVSLKLDGSDGRNCILRDIQFDPVTERPVHFDLQGLREDEEITLEIPVVITGGTPIGIRDGGILQQIMYKLKIMCLPKNIPEHIEVNAENLTMNHFIHVRDLKIENVTFVDNEGSTIVGVVPPTVEKEVTPEVAAVEEGAEPEVIAKGKKPAEGAEGEAAAGEKKPEAGAKAAAPAAAGAPAKEEKKEKKK